jgi:[protein-PII] uridylyltransferase
MTARLESLKAPSSVKLSDGGAAARRRSHGIDAYLQETLDATSRSHPISFVAVGGYGRGELSPHSDIDLLVLVPKRPATSTDDLKRMLYPFWDAGWQVGHAVLTPAEAIARCERDIDAATSLLFARRAAGDEDLFEELLDRRRRWTRKEAKKLVRRIMESTSERHRNVDRAGWALAPDIKEDVGGLRDAHALAWLEAVAEISVPHDEIVQGAELLTAVREALHGLNPRKIDRLRLDLQSSVARRLGLEGGDGRDELMSQVHSAARTIEYRSRLAADAIAQKVLGGPRRSGSTRLLGRGLRIDEGLLHLEGDDRGIGACLKLLEVHSAHGHRIARPTLEAIEKAFDRPPLERWDEVTRVAFVEVLKGPYASRSLELLDHVGGWPVLLPEMANIRGRAQHDPYHRYTVDGHSFLAVAHVTRAVAEDDVATGAATELRDVDSAYIGALLHDIGKGSDEDHSVAGERLAHAAVMRMGLSPSQLEDIPILVRQHLLLADTATRRDLDDGIVIEKTAKSIGTAQRLRQLYIITVADGLATGPAAWSDWKATLVRELYRKTLIALETGEVPRRSNAVTRAHQIESYEPSLAGRAEGVLATLPPSYLDSVSVPDMVDEIRLLLQTPGSGEVRYRIDDSSEAGQTVITICTRDRPGTLARAAGVFALNRISVLRAQAYSTSDGFALERFVAQAPEQASWADFEKDLAAAYSGRLALEAHVERKARDYRPAGPIAPTVDVIPDASTDSTVVEVRCPDALGLLFAITSGLSDLDLDIHVAKIDTLGSRVVDVFYVRTLWGSPLDDAQVAEVAHSIQHRVGRLLG